LSVGKNINVHWLIDWLIVRRSTLQWRSSLTRSSIRMWNERKGSLPQEERGAFAGEFAPVVQGDTLGWMGAHLLQIDLPPVLRHRAILPRFRFRFLPLNFKLFFDKNSCRLPWFLFLLSPASCMCQSVSLQRRFSLIFFVQQKPEPEPRARIRFRFFLPICQYKERKKPRFPFYIQVNRFNVIPVVWYLLWPMFSFLTRDTTF
jgi:hypothetical protein